MRQLCRSKETLGEKVSPQTNRSTGGTVPPGAFLFIAATLFWTGSELGAQNTATSTDELPDVPAATIAERLTVTDTRLHDRPRDLDSIAAHVTLIERDEIEARGAATVQELLALEAGVVLFDVSGHDLGRILDLRGFTGGGVKVYLDGAPLNDPRNNLLSLELIPTVAVERVEITRGSTAARAGGGAEAGVINLWTRSGESFGGQLSLAGGDFSTFDSSVAVWQQSGRTDWFGSGSWYDTAGHRDNAGGSLARLAGSLGWDLSDTRRLQVTLLDSDADFGNPGALRPDELSADRSQAPFNELDFSNERFAQLAVNYTTPLGSSFSLAANAHTRSRDSEILSTGRAAAVFGGFLLDSRTDLAGTTIQIGGGGGSHELSAGMEWLEGDTDARGFFTPPDDPGNTSSASPGSDNSTQRRTLALYLQDSWRPSERWSVTAGLRWDEDDVGYRELTPGAANVSRRTYAELSARVGTTWTPTPAWTLYASLGEAFLPPTVEELFSFPLFGSNPDLAAQDSRSIELGLRYNTGRHGFETALFRIDTADEIIFDPDSPLGLFGANVNGGETRRDGLEVAYRGAPTDRLRVVASATILAAELQAGVNRGNRVPLVPEEQLSAAIDLELGTGFALHAEVLWVGDRVLDNDDANQQPELDTYSLFNARLTWIREEERVAAHGLQLFLEARNLLGNEYATRGIYAFDFSTFANAVFLTPAPPRRLMAGLRWDF